MQQKKEFPHAFQVGIIRRFMSDKDLKSFYETYDSHRQRINKMREPNKNEISLSNLAREHGYRGAAKKAGVAVERVYSAVNRVSRWNFLFADKVKSK